ELALLPSQARQDAQRGGRASTRPWLFGRGLGIRNRSACATWRRSLNLSGRWWEVTTMDNDMLTRARDPVVASARDHPVGSSGAHMRFFVALPWTRPRPHREPLSSTGFHWARARTSSV